VVKGGGRVFGGRRDKSRKEDVREVGGKGWGRGGGGEGEGRGVAGWGGRG